MSVSAKFIADFTSFEAAVSKSEVKLKDWQKSIGNVDKDLTKMATSFSGQAIFQQATLATKGIEAIGGATKLTASEQAKANALVTEAIAKYDALGIQAPADLKKLQQETAKLEPPLTMAQKAAGLLSSSFGQFTAANLVSNAIGAITTKVGEFIATGAKLPAVEASFQKLTSGIHQNGGEMLKAMDTAARGMVSDFDLMQSANKAMLLGLPVSAKEMGEITKAAITMGRAMGIDATKSVSDFVEAIGKGSPEILNNFGIIVKAEDVYKKFAEANDRTVESLTASEKQIAVYNLAMEAARAKTAELGDQTKTLGEIADTAWTKFGNVVSHASADINVGLGASLSSLKGFAALLGDIANVGPGLALQMARTRAEAEAMAKSGHDVNLALEPTVDVLGKYRDHLSGLSTTLQAVTPEQQKLINQAADLGESAGDIAKALGLETVAVQTTIDAHKTAADVARKHGEELDKLNEKLRSQTAVSLERVRIAYGALNKSMVEQGVQLPQLAKMWEGVDQIYIDLAKESDKLNDVLATTNEELDRLGEAFDFAQALSAANAEIDALIDGLSKAQPEASGLTKTFDGMFKGIKSGFHDLVDGMTGSNGISGFMNKLGSGIVSGFGEILSGGLASVIQMGVNLAVEGIAKIGKLIGGLFQSDETKDVNKPRDQFFGQFGNGKETQYQNLAAALTEAAGSGDIANQLITSLYDADNASKFRAAEQAIVDVFAQSGKNVQMFASGGVAMKPTLGVFGEKGPEAVIPLNRLNEVMGDRRAESKRESAMEARLASIESLLRDQPRAIAVAVQTVMALA